MIYIEDATPVVKYNGLNTKKAVDFSGAPSVALPSGTTVAGAQTITSSSANAFVVGPSGTTNSSFRVDASASNAVTGILVTATATGTPPSIGTISSATDENLNITAKGTGILYLNKNTTGAISIQGGGKLVVNNASSQGLAVGPNGTTNPTLNVATNAANAVTGINVIGAAAGSGIVILALSSASAEDLIFKSKSASNILTIGDTLAAATKPLLVGQATDTITGAVTDAYTGGLRLTPTINAATAQTVTRLNYIDVNDVTLGGAGPAAVTNATLFRFNAAAATHKVVDGATTKTTPGGVDAWIKVNLNGTLAYVPVYLSKTA